LCMEALKMDFTLSKQLWLCVVSLSVVGIDVEKSWKVM